jgi:RNA polymerase sporulation-specific sigma factor
MEKQFANFTDEQLVQQAQKGDMLAEEHLIRKYKEHVRKKSKVYFIIGADGEDVMQEGMIGLFKAIRSFDGEQQASFKTFAELCISRQIISAIRTASRKKHEPLNDSVSLNDPVKEDESGVTFQEMLRAGCEMEPEQELLMKSLIEEISSNENKVFSAFELEVWEAFSKGKSYKEIAEGLGKSPKAVDNAIQRTKKKIMESICK